MINERPSPEGLPSRGDVMLDELWFETEGKEHFSTFFRMVENALKEGELRGMRVKRPDAAAMMEMYRGRGYGCYKGYVEDQARVLRK